MNHPFPSPNHTIKITVSISDPDVIDSIESDEDGRRRGASREIELILLATREADDCFHVDVSFEHGVVSGAGAAFDGDEHCRQAMRTARLAAGLVTEMLSQKLGAPGRCPHPGHREDVPS